jgi:hypothetical protein
VTRRLCQWDAWGCSSILISSPLLGFIVIYNANHPLGAAVEVNMLNLDRLAASSPTSIKDLEQIILKFDELVGLPMNVTSCPALRPPIVAPDGSRPDDRDLHVCPLCG